MNCRFSTTRYLYLPLGPRLAGTLPWMSLHHINRAQPFNGLQLRPVASSLSLVLCVLPPHSVSCHT